MSQSRLLSQRPLDVGNWRAFHAVAKELSFRIAAEQLSLTQSAVSRQVRAIENELGMPLFVRTTRKVELTIAGSSLVPTVARMLQGLDQAVVQLRSQGTRQRISLTTFASFASLWLVPRLEDFQRRNAGIDIRISNQDGTIDLDGSDLDLALRYGPEQKALESYKLFDEEIIPLVSPSIAKRLGRDFGLKDLQNSAWIEDGEPVRQTTPWLSWEGWLNARNLNHLAPKSWIYLDYASQMIQSAVAGQGIVLARSPLVLSHIEQGLLLPVLKQERAKSPWSYWLVVKRGAIDRAEVVLFRNWLLEEARLTRQLQRKILGEVKKKK